MSKEASGKKSIRRWMREARHDEGEKEKRGKKKSGEIL